MYIYRTEAPDLLICVSKPLLIPSPQCGSGKSASPNRQRSDSEQGSVGPKGTLGDLSLAVSCSSIM
jgi:hypothetical protein